MGHRLPSLLIAALAAYGTAAAQTTPPPTGAVTGHVYCADTHTPCRFASVTLEIAPQPRASGSGSAKSKPRNYAASTDLDGAFQITGVLPGDYYILARQTGYFLPYDLAINEFSDDPAQRAKAIDAVLPRITVTAGLTTTSVLNLSRRRVSLRNRSIRRWRPSLNPATASLPQRWIRQVETIPEPLRRSGNGTIGTGNAHRQSRSLH